MGACERGYCKLNRVEMNAVSGYIDSSIIFFLEIDLLLSGPGWCLVDVWLLLVCWHFLVVVVGFSLLFWYCCFVIVGLAYWPLLWKLSWLMPLLIFYFKILLLLGHLLFFCFFLQVLGVVGIFFCDCTEMNLEYIIVDKKLVLKQHKLEPKSLACPCGCRQWLIVVSLLSMIYHHHFFLSACPC